MTETYVDEHDELNPGEAYSGLFPLLNEISSVRQFRSDLPNLAATAIERGDTFCLLLLASEAVRWHEWQSAAQLYTYVMVLAFDHPWPQQTFVFHTNHVLMLSHCREGGLGSATDVALYAFRRLLRALRREGIVGRHANDWMTNALHEISKQSPARARAVHTAIQAIAPDHVAVVTEPELQPHVGPAYATVVRTAWRMSDDVKDNVFAETKAVKQNLAWLFLGIALAIAVGWSARDAVQFPLSSELFKGANWLGAALMAWPLLLIITWVFAFLEAKRTGTLNDIHPRHLLLRHKITAGEVMPFSKDWFFHIFQFVWIPLLIIAAGVMAHYEALPNAAALVWAYPATAVDQLPRFLSSLPPTPIPALGGAETTLERVRMVLSNDYIALVVATVVAAIFMANQIRIQRNRIRTDVNFYWWDRRVSLPEWTVRLAMVGVDTFLGMFVLLKISAIALVASQLVATDQLNIVYFSADGVGGMKFLMDILKMMSWLVFLFGLFVIGSVSLHWNLPEYRKTDAALFVAYLVLVVLAMIPLFLLDGRLGAARESLIMSLPIPVGTLTGDKISEAAGMLRDLNEIRNWSVSAWSWELANSPILPLAGQLLFAVGQFFVREGGGKRFSMNRLTRND